jgi:23S rRNA U2552 (ribose-2'-O)-methylase RlmE/FtsJ
MKVLFLDESGDHNLSVIDPQYPLFVLGGVIMDLDYAKGQWLRTHRLAQMKEANPRYAVISLWTNNRTFIQ